MPNINTSSPPITSVKELKLFGMDENEEVGWIFSNSLVPVADYAAGIEITQYNQVIRDENGEFWRVSGQVDLPYVPTGAGIPEDDALVPVGDAVLRQDLANPDKGAAMVARGVVAVDSIADLLALPEGQRKEGLRYLVKGYHAGSDVGGGEFEWAEGSTEAHNGCTVLAVPGIPVGRFCRLGRMATKISDWGAVGGEICDDAFDRAWLYADIGSTLTIDVHPNGNPYILDYSRPPRTTPMHVKGEPGNLIKLADQSSIFHNPAEITNRALLPIMASDSSFDGVNLDVNGQNNWLLIGGLKKFSQSSNRVDGIAMYGSPVGSSSPISNIAIKNCSVSNPIWQAIALNGGMINGDGAYSYEATHGIDGFEVSGNTLSQGAQSILNLSGGVRNGKVSGNKGYDCYYDMIRCYRQVLDVDIFDNTYTLRPSGLLGASWVLEGYIPWRQGIRVGHNSSEVGTCRDIRIFNNTLTILDPTILTMPGSDNQGLIRVSEMCTGISVWDNKLTPGRMAYGINLESVGEDVSVLRNEIRCSNLTTSGIRAIGSPSSIEVSDNKIIEPRDQGLRLPVHPAHFSRGIDLRKDHLNQDATTSLALQVTTL